MLTIKRVPTVLSNYQEEDSSDGAGCGRSCLGECCLPVSTLPLYAFNKEENYSKSENDNHLDFLALVLEEWDDRMRRGLFRYDVADCETRVIPGKHGFIAQLNEGRHLKKRPTEFRVDRVLQPFDPSKFNFTKVGQEEVLLRFEAADAGGTSRFVREAPVTSARSTNVVAINVSPIEYGHVLLIPRVLECLPQRIDPESFLLALHMAAEARSKYFRLGYNSLGAFATINHLHFQAYYLSASLPVEVAPVQEIPTTEESRNRGVRVFRLLDYPLRGLVFVAGKKSLRDLSDTVSAACVRLQNSNVPFNVLVSDSGERVFLFPQSYAERQALGGVSRELLDTQVNPAVWEIAGHMVLKRKEDYGAASEDRACRLLAEASLSEARFEEVVVACVLEAAGIVEEERGSGTGGEAAEQLPQFRRPLRPASPPRFPGGCLV